MPYGGKTNLAKGRKPPADSAHSCGCCTKSHPPGRSSCPARDDHCRGCGKLGHWKPKCRSGQKGPKDKGPKHLNRGGKQRKVNEVGTDEDPYYDEFGVRTIELSDVQIDSTTKAFATVEMPAEIGPNKPVTLKCKVDTGAGGNVMPLRAFAKLFPRRINADGSPRGLKSSTICLTAYNGSKIPQFGTLDTAIDWTPKGKRIANRLQTTMVHCRHTGTSNPRTPIMCQTWHRGAQLCSQPPEEKVGAAEEAHHRRQKMSTKIFNTPTHYPSTQKKTSSRHIRTDSKELAGSQGHVSHHLTQ